MSPEEKEQCVKMAVENSLNHAKSIISLKYITKKENLSDEEFDELARLVWREVTPKIRDLLLEAQTKESGYAVALMAEQIAKSIEYMISRDIWRAPLRSEAGESNPDGH